MGSRSPAAGTVNLGARRKLFCPGGFTRLGSAWPLLAPGYSGSDAKLRQLSAAAASRPSGRSVQAFSAVAVGRCWGLWWIARGWASRLAHHRPGLVRRRWVGIDACLADCLASGGRGFPAAPLLCGRYRHWPFLGLWRRPTVSRSSTDRSHQLEAQVIALAQGGEASESAAAWLEISMAEASCSFPVDVLALGAVGRCCLLSLLSGPGLDRFAVC